MRPGIHVKSTVRLEIPETLLQPGRELRPGNGLMLAGKPARLGDVTDEQPGGIGLLARKPQEPFDRFQVT